MLEEKVDELVVAVRVLAETVDRRHEEIMLAIVEQRRYTEYAFGLQNERSDGLEGRLVSLGGRFDTLERRFDALEGRFDALEHRVDAIERRLATLEHRVEVLEGKMDAVTMLIVRMDHKLDQFMASTDRHFRAIEDRLS